ncbi:MAG: GNAT family N-acetyltransferase [Bacteroidaceae bacterium]|nr:GNAT family N-acetyltransferase [Bacteroidaceae bacterium]
MQMCEIVRYNPTKSAEWDAFVRTSRNGTFLFERGYMDYHAHRFVDCSLMCYREGKLVALLPANWVEEEKCVYSHQGLTYGGLVMADELTSIRVLEIFDTMLEWMRTELGGVRMVYKPIPYIYSNCPSEEDLYALFRHEAVLHTRGISSVVDMGYRLPMSKGRKSAVKQALKQGLRVEESTDLLAFWQILEQVLRDRHHASPVHSVEEMLLLQSRFPEHIRLYVVYSSDDRMLAGTVIYEMPHLVHAQYIASSPEGKELGAVDALYAWLIDERYADKHYLDFGVSTEQGGRVLNEGLVRQKEAFGARAVVYDSYSLTL